MQQDNCEFEKTYLIKILGEIIKQKRLEKKKSIYLISAECLMSKSTWREAEIGACKDINLSTLFKIADGLEIPLSDLIFELEKRLKK